jgi:hypothetical protein
MFGYGHKLGGVRNGKRVKLNNILAFQIEKQLCNLLSFVYLFFIDGFQKVYSQRFLQFRPFIVQKKNDSKKYFLAFFMKRKSNIF